MRPVLIALLLTACTTGGGTTEGGSTASASACLLSKDAAAGLFTGTLDASAPDALKAALSAGEADVSAAIDAASKARLAPTELADALTLAATAAETYGAVTGFGVWFSERVAAGDRGVVLADAIEVEHQSEGAKAGAEKVEICHAPPGNPDNAHTISVGASALDAHLKHGDTQGACADDGSGGHGKGRAGGAGAHKPEKGGGPTKGNSPAKGGGKGHGKH